MDAKQQAVKQFEQAIDDLAKAVGEHEAKGGDPADILDNLHSLTDHFSEEGKARLAQNAISDTPPELRAKVVAEGAKLLTAEERKRLLAALDEMDAANDAPASDASEAD